MRLYVVPFCTRRVLCCSLYAVRVVCSVLGVPWREKGSHTLYPKTCGPQDDDKGTGQGQEGRGRRRVHFTALAEGLSPLTRHTVRDVPMRISAKNWIARPQKLH